MTWVLTDADLAYLHEALRAAEEVVLDLETTGLDEHADGSPARNGGVAARVVLAQFTLPAPDRDWGTEPTTWVVPLSHPSSPWAACWRPLLARLARTLRDSAVPLVGHNVKFDLRWIAATTGVSLAHLLAWDTRLSAHLLDENATTRLKAVAPAAFGVEPWDDIPLDYPGAAERAPLFDLGVYGAQDTYWTSRLADLHRERLWVRRDPDERDAEPDGPEEVEEARLGLLARWVVMPTAATLTAIEERGLLLDQDWARQALAEYRQQAEVLGQALAARYPVQDPAARSFAPTSRWFRAWVEEAVARGDLRVTERTGRGVPSWGKATLVRQARQGSAVAADLLDLRSASKRAEFLASWLGKVSPAGAIHATYNQGSVVTGRLSSSEPNLQQVTSALRPAFVPRPGFLLLELDYSQIELRVAAHVSGCRPMIEAFRRGDDLHVLLAARLAGKAPEDVTRDERQHGKTANFGLLYQMGPSGFRTYAETAYGVTFTQDQAERIHRTFYATWDGIGAWHARAIHRARSTGRVVSPIGRVRRLPDILSPDDALAGRAERAAVNAPVQGFASDLMSLASASIAGFLPGSSPIRGAHLVGTVHDSVLLEVAADRWQDVARECLERMTDLEAPLARLGCSLTVPLVVEGKCGTRWGLADVGTVSG